MEVWSKGVVPEITAERELRKGGLEREQQSNLERNTANPCRLHDFELTYWHSLS